MDSKQYIGAAIRGRRKELGWRQEDLAERVNTTNSSISRIETGAREVGIEELEKILAVLDLHLDLIVGQARPRPSEAGSMNDVNSTMGPNQVAEIPVDYGLGAHLVDLNLFEDVTVAFCRAARSQGASYRMKDLLEVLRGIYEAERVGLGKTLNRASDAGRGVGA